MRVTKKTNIAIRLLMYCAANPDRLVTKTEVARSCNISENHLAQVTHKLSNLDYIQTQRGRNGGMLLARPAKEIRIGDVFRDLESNRPLAECFDPAENTCPLVLACRLRHALIDAAEAFYARMDDVTLDDLVRGNDDLLLILSSHPAPASR